MWESRPCEKAGAPAMGGREIQMKGTAKNFPSNIHRTLDILNEQLQQNQMRNTYYSSSTQSALHPQRHSARQSRKRLQSEIMGTPSQDLRDVVGNMVTWEYSEKADLHWSRGDVESAVAFYSVAISSDPEDETGLLLRCYSARSTAYLSIGRLAEAVEDAQTVVDLKYGEDVSCTVQIGELVAKDRLHQDDQKGVDPEQSIDDARLYWWRRMINDEETNQNLVVMLQKLLSLLLGSVLIIILTLLVILCLEVQANKRKDKRVTMRGSQLDKIMDGAMDEMDANADPYAAYYDGLQDGD